jgi:predicted branched-subunit amino acid permease
VASTALGAVLGAQLHLPPGHPLFFAALGAFVSVLAQMWRGLGDLLPWAVAAVVAVLVAQVLPGTFWYIVAGAIAGSIVGGVRDHRRRMQS